MTVLYFKNYQGNTSVGPGNPRFLHDRGVAWTGNDGWYCSGLNEGGTIHQIMYPHPDYKELKDWVRVAFNEFNPVESSYVPGTFYKRIHRPLVCGNALPGIADDKLTQSYVTIRMLLSKLEDLFETVEPNKRNMGAHGHKIRELLLLACMEVESSWSAVLRENNYQYKGYLRTSDYVKLTQPMFLETYAMHLTQYAHLGDFTPFKNWYSEKPTESLQWYSAYNKTKHDREGNLDCATLENAINAVAAALSMLYAQFGTNLTPGAVNHRDSAIRTVFNYSPVGLQRYERDFYIPKVSASNWSPPSSYETRSWVALDYPF